MSNSKIEKEAASKAINKTIGMVEDALKIEVPHADTPSERREIMITMLVATLTDATERGGSIGWGSSVKAKVAIRQPVWVEFVQGRGADADGRMTMTAEYERMLDEVAKHLHKGKKLVVLGETGWSDDYVRWILMKRNRTYREQNPAYRRKNRWNVQPPAEWNVFYVLGMDDLEDSHTRGLVARALKAGKRIIDISKIKPSDLTDDCQSYLDKRRRVRQRRAKPVFGIDPESKPARTRRDDEIVWGMSKPARTRRGTNT